MKKLSGLLFIFLAIVAFTTNAIELNLLSQKRFFLRFEKKGQYVETDKFDGETALCLVFNCQEAPWADLSLDLTKQHLIEKFDSAKILVRAFLPEDGNVRDVCLRLIDNDGEVFQYRKSVAKLNGWQNLVYEISDSSKPYNSCWSGKVKNKVLDFPIKILGFAVDYKIREGNGYVGLANIKVYCTPSNDKK